LSFNGGAYAASLSATMKHGTTLTVIDNDIMPHTFVQVSGPKLHIPASAFMHRMGASTKVLFAKPGVYRFTTKPGEDYPSMSNMKTVGEDYVLRLKVRVT
jgi:plastocyanin